MHCTHTTVGTKRNRNWVKPNDRIWFNLFAHTENEMRICFVLFRRRRRRRPAQLCVHRKILVGDFNWLYPSVLVRFSVCCLSLLLLFSIKSSADNYHTETYIHANNNNNEPDDEKTTETISYFICVVTCSLSRFGSGRSIKFVVRPSYVCHVWSRLYMWMGKWETTCRRSRMKRMNWEAKAWRERTMWNVFVEISSFTFVHIIY